MVRVIRFEIPVHMLLAWLTGRVKVTSTNREVTYSDFFYKDITCTARLHWKLRSIVGETISFLDGLSYINVLCVIRWGSTHSFPSVHFSNRATSEKFIEYLLYSALYPCKYYYTIYRTEDTLRINIYVKEVRYCKWFLSFLSFRNLCRPELNVGCI